MIEVDLTSPRWGVYRASVRGADAEAEGGLEVIRRACRRFARRHPGHRGELVCIYRNGEPAGFKVRPLRDWIRT